MRRSIFRDDQNAGILFDDPRHTIQDVELGPFNVYLCDIDSLPRRQLIVKLNHLDFNRGFNTG